MPDTTVSSARRQRRRLSSLQVSTILLAILIFSYAIRMVLFTTLPSVDYVIQKETLLQEPHSTGPKRLPRKSSWKIKEKTSQSDVSTGAKKQEFNDICWTLDCIRSRAQPLARAFSYRPKSSWCFDSTSSPGQGLFLVKIPKSASSTAAGVTLRIAHRHGCESVQWMHRPGHEYSNRTRDASYLWTTVRDPARRAVSTIYFHAVSRQNNQSAAAATATDEFVLSHLKRNHHVRQGARSKGRGWGFQVQYAATEALLALSPGDLHQVEQVVGEIMEGYDFIMLTERTDESLVAMALSMGIAVADVLVMSSKVAGSHYHLVHYGKGVFICLPTVPAPRQLSRPIQSYLDSDAWRALSYGDYLLHAAVNASLDLTIQQIGEETFAGALKEFLRLKQMEMDQCASNVKFPCSDDGRPQESNCYLQYYDFGCGYECVDNFLEKDKRNKIA